MTSSSRSIPTRTLASALSAALLLLSLGPVSSRVWAEDLAEPVEAPSAPGVFAVSPALLAGAIAPSAALGAASAAAAPSVGAAIRAAFPGRTSVAGALDSQTASAPEPGLSSQADPSPAAIASVAEAPGAPAPAAVRGDLAAPVGDLTHALAGADSAPAEQSAGALAAFYDAAPRGEPQGVRVPASAGLFARGAASDNGVLPENDGAPQARPDDEQPPQPAQPPLARLRPLILRATAAVKAHPLFWSYSAAFGAGTVVPFSAIHGVVLGGTGLVLASLAATIFVRMNKEKLPRKSLQMMNDWGVALVVLGTMAFLGHLSAAALPQVLRALSAAKF